MAFTPINVSGASVGNNTGFQPISFDQARQGLASINNVAKQQLQQQESNAQMTQNTFSTPSSEILSGQGAQAGQQGVGALKQIASDISSTGAQNAGPVGKAMLANAPAFAQDINAAKGAMQPTNFEQTKGAIGTSLAEGMIPGQGASSALPKVAGEVLGDVGEASKVGGKVVESAAQKLGTEFIPKSEQEAGMLQTYKANNTFADRLKSLVTGGLKAPTTAAQTAFNKGLAGTESMLGVQAKRAQGKLWTGLIQPALDQSKTEVYMPSFFQQAEQKIASETADPTRKNALMDALSAVKEDFGDTGKISMKQLQKFKEGWAEFVPEKAYKGQNIAGALNDVRNTLAGMARSTIYNDLGGEVKQAYLDYGNLNAITALGKKAMAGSKFKGGAGNFLHGLYEMATVPAGTIGGQALYKVGQGLEIAGLPGATTLGGVLGLQKSQNQ